MGDEVREGKAVECGETGGLVRFRSTLNRPDLLVCLYIILTCGHAQVLELCMEAGVRCM